MPMHKKSRPKSSFAFYCLISLVLTACLGQSSSNTVASKTDRAPDWVLQPPSDSRYIYGVGSAQKLDDLAQSVTNARRQANADIASQLRVTISQSNLQSTEVTSGTNQSEQVINSMASQTRSNIETLALEQSETVESQQSGNYVYVLQRLDRVRMVSRLSQEIDDIDAQLDKIAISLNPSTDAVSQWRDLLPALPLLANRVQSLELLNLYSKNALSKSKPASVQALEVTLSELLLALSIQVESDTPQSNALISHVQSALTQKGLTPEEARLANNSPSPLKLVLDFSTKVEQQGARTYVFLTVEATLQQLLNQGSMLASWTINERGVSSIQTQAKLAADQKAASSLADAVFQHLTQGQ